jgi:hypothetical protein
MMSELFPRKVLRVVYIDPCVDDYIREVARATRKPPNAVFTRLLLLGMKIGKQPVR